ncbi:coiled-coil domain-containing protein 34 [Drosophila santomea]|uniref:coiled-coil domain-containing protein 34 n=1 Tax=Drosophila santomea TaxID=129105 RepID=UPI001952C8B3|nr:coiled-coil domain-containing protein 34 [Drosophila santomea]
MAFCGHVSSSGQIVLRDEIFTSRTRVISSSRGSPNSMSSPSSLAQDTTTRTYFFKDAAENPSPQSTGYWSPEGLKRSQNQSSLVPSLCLNSPDSSLNYLRHVKGIKVDRQPEAAYENWYSAKQQQLLDKQRRIKEELNFKQQQREERKQLARMCYDQWLKDKSRQAANLQLENHIQEATMKASLALRKSPLVSLRKNPLVSASSSLGCGRSSSTSSRAIRKVSKDEIRRVVEDWWLKKQRQQQAQREERRRAMMSKAFEEEQRRQLAQAAWSKWMSNVDAKPKPVPLNQGLDSLRGTVSQLYVNPNSWMAPAKQPQM